MTSSTTARVKKSFSISKESALFIKKVRKLRKIASDSQALDLLIQEALAAERQQGINAAYTAYYDNASEADLKAEAEWAELAAPALAEVVWSE